MSPASDVGRVAVVTCMDSRLRVGRFGLSADQIHVLRNAGGRATNDVIRSLIVAWRVLEVQEFVVVHTDCRMMTTTNEQLREDLASAVHTDVAAIDFMPFANLRASVEDDVDRISRSPYFDGQVPTSGFVWDLRVERLQPVVVDPRSRLASGLARRRPGRSGSQTPTGGIGRRVAVPSGGVWKLDSSVKQARIRRSAQGSTS